MTSTISSKGQITVPKAIRTRLGLRAGTRVAFELTADGAVLRRDHSKRVSTVDRVRGILKRSVSTDLLIDQMRGPLPAFPRKRR
jgi:AbrB family looped-hinge helix DNA binding protein